MTQFPCEDRRQLGDKSLGACGLHHKKELYKPKMFKVAGKHQSSALSHQIQQLAGKELIVSHQTQPELLRSEML